MSVARDITERKHAEQALHESEDKFKHIFEYSIIGKSVTHFNGDIHVNRAVCNLLGYTFEEMQNKKWQEITHPDDIELTQKYIDSLVSGEKESVRFDKRYIHKSGIIVWVDLSSSIRRDRQYKPLYLMSAMIDITDRKQNDQINEGRLRLITYADAHSTDEILRETLDELENLTNSKIGFYHFLEADQETLTLQNWSSRTLKEMCTAEGKHTHYHISKAGVWADSIRTHSPVIHNDYASLADKKGMPEGHAEVTRELVVPVFRNNKIVAILGVGNKIENYNEKDVAIVSKFADMAWEIIERKKTEEELRESEDKYRGVVENSPNAIAMYVDGKIVFVNNQCVQLMAAANKEDLIGKSVIQFVHPDNRAMVIERMKQLAIDGKPLPTAEEKFIRLDGTSVDVEVRAVPTNYKQKPAVQLIVQDITERKNNEQALRQAQKLESIGTLAGGIAHDFNNLMNAVLGQSSIALNKLPKESPAANNIQKAIKAGERVADLTKQLLAYSGRGRFVIDEIDLNKLVKENVAMLEVSIPKTTQLRYELGNPSPHIMGDISQIQQVIMNLIINAGEAMGSHPGFITIHTNRIELPENNSAYSKYSVTPIAAGSYAMLQVKDNGSGISEETLARIFDPFFTTKFTGRGLGLAAVLGIIKGHKGGLRIESEVGKGTMFEIIWPLVEASTISNITEKKEIEVNGEGKTILVIDDEFTVIELVNDVLSESNFKVMSALDPIKGIDLYRQHHQTITMVVLDYSMPHMDGKAAFEKLLEINKEVKVLLCSGYTEEETMSVFGIDRPTGFFHKPYMPDALLERVGEIVSRDR
jgi:PAS domain S-box-containing protein